MKIQKVDLQQVLPIRQRVLWPDKPISFCQVANDDTASHFGGFIDQMLVCVASVYIDGNEARLRKFATLVEYQGQGVGSGLLRHVLDQLAFHNVDYFWCDARTSAVDFYRRFGLQVEGGEFEKSGVMYCKMSCRRK